MTLQARKYEASGTSSFRYHIAKLPLAVALRKICHYQKSTELLVPKIQISCVVREILHNDPCKGRLEIGNKFRIQSEVLATLHEAAEAMLVTEFQCES